MIQENEPLAKYSSFQIGGPARYFSVCSSLADLKQAVGFAGEKNLPWFVLAGGSNVLISDQGFAGLVIKMEIKDFAVKDDLFICGAGVSLSAAVSQAWDSGLSGLEWAWGIPGTVGGAVRGNAGAYGSEMKDSVLEAEVLRGEEVLTLPNPDCSFGYRESVFKQEGNCDIILKAVLKLCPKDKREIEEKMREIALKRENKFDRLPSAGSVFKNIVLPEKEIREFKGKFPQLPDEFVSFRKIPSAWLIDQCELRGKEIGRARVSNLHAGVIVNAGRAKAQEVVILISLIKQKVRSKFNLQLFEEIEYLGF